MDDKEQPMSMEYALELIPKTWNYKLVEIIGKGKATTVFSGKQTRCGDRKVAVKCFHMPEEVPDEIVKREADALRMLKHENIIRFFELARANGTKHLLIAMELVEDGLSLETVVCQFRRKKALEASVLAKWVAELAGAVQYMHENGVIHRDVSPKNILVSGKVQRSEEEKVWMSLSLKLGNFGSSKILLDGCKFSNTLVSADHSYMAPEIVEAYKTKKGAVRHDRTVDYWSLGAVIIFLGNRKHLMQRVQDLSDKKKMSIRISKDIDAAKRQAKHPPTNVPEDFWALAIKAIDRDPWERSPPSKYLESDFIKRTYRKTVEAGLPTGAGPSVPATPRVRAPAPGDLKTGASQRPCGSMTATPATIKGKDAGNPPTKQGTVAATPAGKKVKAIATAATTGNAVATAAAKGAAAVATTATEGKDAVNPPTEQGNVAATPAGKKGKAAATPAAKEENAVGYNLRSRSAIASKTTATKKP